MKLNHAKFFYIPVRDMPSNVVRQVERNALDDASDTEFDTTIMRDFTVRLARRHPEWLMVTEYSRIDGLRIFCNEEYLGRAAYRKEWSSSSYRFELDNPRLKAKRDPKREAAADRLGNATATRTKDIDRALRLVKDNFGPANHVEYAGKMFSDTHKYMKEKHSSVYWKFMNLFTNERFKVQTFRFLMDRWDEFKAACPEAPLDMRPVFGPYEASTYIQLAWREKTGFFVSAYKDGYVVGRTVNGTDSTFLLTQDFSDEFKLKLAMLKIAADNQIIPDTGMRINSDTFFILSDKEPTNANP